MSFTSGARAYVWFAVRALPRIHVIFSILFFSFSFEMIYVPLRECVPRSHFSRFLCERITCWNSFWNGLVSSHLGTRLLISFSACLLYLSLTYKQRKNHKNTIIFKLHVLVNKYLKVTIKLIGTEEGPHLWPKRLPS